MSSNKRCGISSILSTKKSSAESILYLPWPHDYLVNCRNKVRKCWCIIGEVGQTVCTLHICTAKKLALVELIPHFTFAAKR